jgi:hypothetical protein
MVYDNALVALASGNITDKMTLLVVQVLQVEVERIDLGLCFLGLLFSVARIEKCATVEAAQLGQVGVKELLLATEAHLSIRVWLSGAVLVDKVEHLQTLLASIGGGLQDGLKEGVGHECAGVHGRLVRHDG